MKRCREDVISTRTFPLVSQVSCVAETINLGVENLFEFQALTLPRPHSVNMLPNQEGQKKQERSRSKVRICSKVVGNHLFFFFFFTAISAEPRELSGHKILFSS